MIELLCAWCLSTVTNGKILAVGECASGKPEDMARAVYALKNSGVLFNGECKRTEESFAINWKNKAGIDFLKEEKK